MLGGKRLHEAEPGDFVHDAGQIAKLGKVGCIAFGLVGVAGEVGDFISDVAGSEGIADDLRAAGGWGVAAVATYAVFGALQNHYEKRTQEIRDRHVTD
jgi:hypothetical protein